ncbi:MAG: thiamine-phosphate kinase [Candidatus Acidiferrales bacterium]
MDTERHLIERSARALSFNPRGRGARYEASFGLRLGIGDDAAIFAPSGKEQVVTCDAFIEGVHFFGDSSPNATPADAVGYKALVRATSDLAAMGATPRYFLLTLALPRRLTGRWLDGLLGGMRRATRELKLEIAGGDTTQNDQVALSLTVIGEIGAGRALTRSGARPGDLIYVSGPLGRAQLGLELIRLGLGGRKKLRVLLQPHLYPRIPIELGRWLAAGRAASAAMDISDGLSTDLARLCAASGVGARVWAERIPRVVIPTELYKRMPRPQSDALAMALHGGDDYGLLFTVPPVRAGVLAAAPGFRALAQIGEITRARKIVLEREDGSARALESLGWDSFRR